MPSREIEYSKLVDSALRGVVRAVLDRVAEEGLPGAHHFFIGIRTDHPEVEMPPSLRQSYPETMTVVLQHQFWDLRVDDAAFEVSLRFAGQQSRLRIPWEAVDSFIDPAAEFGFRFGAGDEVAAEDAAVEESSNGDQDQPGDVVSLEEFRKKDDGV